MASAPFKRSVRFWLVFALAAVVVGSVVGCSKKKDKKTTGETVIPHHNPNGMSPVRRRGIITGPASQRATPQGGNAVLQPEIREALDHLVMFGGALGTEYMRGIVSDIETGRILVRFPGSSYSRFQLPDKGGAVADVCIDRYQKKSDEAGILDQEQFKQCNEATIINMKTLAQFAQAQRAKLGGDAHAIRVAYAHVLAAQWVQARNSMKDRELLQQQPNLLQALFAAEDVAWKEGSSVDEASARTLRALYLIYRQAVSFEVSRRLGSAGMSHPILNTMLRDPELATGYFLRQLQEQQALELSEELVGALAESARGATDFGQFIQKIQPTGTPAASSENLFQRTIGEVRTSFNLTASTPAQ